MPVRAKLAMICALNYLWWAAREAKQHALIQVLGFVLRHAWRNQLANRMLHHRHPEGWTLTSPGRDPSQQGHGPPYSPIKPTVFSHMGGPTTASLTNGDICTSVFSRFGYQKRSKVVPHSWKESPWQQHPFTSQSFSPSCNCSKKMVLLCKGASAWYKLGKYLQVIACPPGRRGEKHGHWTFTPTQGNDWRVKTKIFLGWAALQEDKIFSTVMFLDTIFLTINFMPHMPQQLWFQVITKEQVLILSQQPKEKNIHK